MSKTKYYTDGGFFYKSNRIDDLFDHNRFYSLSLDEIKKLTGKTTEREAKKVCKDLFTEMMEMISVDIIENNDCFVFPLVKMGYIGISETTDIDREDYVFNIDTGGKTYGSRIVLDKRNLKRNKKHYRFRLTRENHIKLQEAIENGMRY